MTVRKAYDKMQCVKDGNLVLLQVFYRLGKRYAFVKMLYAFSELMAMDLIEFTKDVTKQYNVRRAVKHFAPVSPDCFTKDLMMVKHALHRGSSVIYVDDEGIKVLD